ncbi:MAG: hypothetical protein CMQ21_05350 [Gammaproteobacteria bacterium]|nr:hypothetical protein [Gammaproteobacteria bacterium]
MIIRSLIHLPDIKRDRTIISCKAGFLTRDNYCCAVDSLLQMLLHHQKANPGTTGGKDILANMQKRLCDDMPISPMTFPCYRGIVNPCPASGRNNESRNTLLFTMKLRT